MEENTLNPALLDLEAKTLRLDNTKRRSFSTCPRKFYFEHILNIRTPYVSTALRYGLAWHKAMEIFLKNLPLSYTHSLVLAAADAATTFEDFASSRGLQEIVDYRSKENLFLSLVKYAETFQEDEKEVEVLSTEKTFSIPVFQKLGFEVHFTGAIDAVVFLSGNKYILEHKTTSQALSIQQNRLFRDPQLLGYYFAAGEMEEDLFGCLVNMHHLASTKSKTTGEWGKARIDFSRVPQVFSTRDMKEWRKFFVSQAERVLSSLEDYVTGAGVDKAFPSNYDSCYSYGRCSFANICEAQSSLEEAIPRLGYVEGKHWNVLDRDGEVE